MTVILTEGGESFCHDVKKAELRWGWVLVLGRLSVDIHLSSFTAASSCRALKGGLKGEFAQITVILFSDTLM